VDWDTGETTFGELADAASPWKTRDAPPLEESWANQPGTFQTLMSGLLDVIGVFGGGGGHHGGFKEQLERNQGLVLPFASMNWVVIPFQEACQLEILGQEYARYCRTVRRWV
jgi:hypothetical protein